MALSDREYQAFKREMFAFIWRELDPYESEIERTDKVPREILPKLSRARCFGLVVPKEFGGVGLTISQYVEILAELSKIHGGIRVLVHVHNTTAKAVGMLGSDKWKAELLPKIATGEASVAFGLTEPDAGTGKDLRTRAVRDGKDFVLNGRKWLITNSDIATHFMVFCHTRQESDGAGISALLVPRGAPGFRIEPLPPTMGCRGGEHGLLTFENCRVPCENLLGDEGQGLHQMTVALEVSRLLIAATSLGTAERSLELSLEFAKKRVTFGKSLAERQAIQIYLAEMGADIYALRNMIRDAAAKADRGERIPTEASMCKLFGLEAVGRVTDRALLIHGGIGYTQKYPIERLYRDARLNWLEEGTPTIQQLVIARNLLNGYKWSA
ncbi:MAG: acyl-CoA dehydrogenase family protein [Hyphomonadaceae bacterium]|nr:acyl-CoA dehydrogenase family protein [Hyphomonadaceae bacterium]